MVRSTLKFIWKTLIFPFKVAMFLIRNRVRLAAMASNALSWALMVGLLVLILFSPLRETAAADRMFDNIRQLGRVDERACTVLNAYRERAKKANEGYDEPEDGLMAVSWVVVNRLAIGFRQAGPAPRTLCEVVWARNQFSWTSWADPFRVAEENREDFRRTYRAVGKVFRGDSSALAVLKVVGTADHYFNADKVLPTWAAAMEDRGKVGSHTFRADLSRNASRRTMLERRYAMR